jgi:hypothetical protein
MPTALKAGFRGKPQNQGGMGVVKPLGEKRKNKIISDAKWEFFFIKLDKKH